VRDDQHRVAMMVRLAMSALLPLVLANWTLPDGTIERFSYTADVNETAVGASDQDAAKDIAIGRFYISKRDYIAAINLFKVVLTHYPASPYVEEALARLAESCLALLSDVPPRTKLNREFLASEAQTAVAVLDRKFPDSDLSIEVHAALRSAGLAPLEDEKSRISRAFK
jgi:outer membrane protein assembly factor BamD